LGWSDGIAATLFTDIKIYLNIERPDMNGELIKPVRKGFRRVYYGLTEAGNSQVEGQLEKLDSPKGDRETAGFVVKQIIDIENYGLAHVRPRASIKGIVELGIHEGCSGAAWRLFVGRTSIDGREVFVLLRLLD